MIGAVVQVDQTRFALPLGALVGLQCNPLARGWQLGTPGTTSPLQTLAVLERRTGQDSINRVASGGIRSITESSVFGAEDVTS